MTTSLWATGTIDVFQAGSKQQAALLAKVRKENIQSASKGPLKSLHLRYRDLWAGKSRTFLWSAQSFIDSDGHVSYALVISEVLSKGNPKILVAAGTSGLSLAGLAETEEDEGYQVVYEAFDDYVKKHGILEKLHP